MHKNITPYFYLLYFSIVVNLNPFIKFCNSSIIILVPSMVEP